VDAVTAAALQQVGDGIVDVVEVVAQGAEAVDDQHDVGRGQAGQPSGRVGGAELADGVDAVRPEDLFAGGEHAAHFLDGAAYPFAVGASRDAADVRERGQGLQTAADQVDAVDADLARGVGEREGQGQGTQQGGLAGLRAADDRGVAAGGGEVQRPCHCRAGSSSRPSGTLIALARSASCMPRPLTSIGPAASSRVRAGGSGGSQIRRTGSPADFSWSTMTTSSVGPRVRWGISGPSSPDPDSGAPRVLYAGYGSAAGPVSSLSRRAGPRYGPETYPALNRS
jgi:hypothetical protein